MKNPIIIAILACVSLLLGIIIGRASKKTSTEELEEEVKNKAEDLKEKAEEVVDEAKETVKEATE